MNKQGSTYTIIYIIVLVVVVGVALSWTAMSLKPRQQANADADKQRQILMAAHLEPKPGQPVKDLYETHIKDAFVVNDRGEKVADVRAFDVNVQNEAKLPAAERKLPVYVCTLADGSVKYILPCYGAGLWGPIWGYVAVDANGSTVYGAYFSHESETPGLGAKISEKAFCDQFNPAVRGSKTLNLFKDGRFVPVDVVKKGAKPADDADYVDGISGGTITSKGVASMLLNCLAPYRAYLETLQNK